MTSNVHSVLTIQRGPGRATIKVAGLEKDVKVKRDQTRMAEKATQILTATVITVLLFTVLFLDGRRFFSNEPSVDGRELNFLTRPSPCLRSLLRCQHLQPNAEAIRMRMRLSVPWRSANPTHMPVWGASGALAEGRPPPFDAEKESVTKDTASKAAGRTGLALPATRLGRPHSKPSDIDQSFWRTSEPQGQLPEAQRLISGRLVGGESRRGGTNVGDNDRTRNQGMEVSFWKQDNPAIDAQKSKNSMGGLRPAGLRTKPTSQQEQALEVSSEALPVGGSDGHLSHSLKGFLSLAMPRPGRQESP